jgi:hypothetical protein
MAGEKDRERWRAEFHALGRDKVRSKMMLGQFPPDKRVFARRWLELHDVEEWQARGGGGTGSGLGKLRTNPRLWGAIGGLILGGFALLRIIRQIKTGF